MGDVFAIVVAFVLGVAAGEAAFYGSHAAGVPWAAALIFDVIAAFGAAYFVARALLAD